MAKDAFCSSCTQGYHLSVELIYSRRSISIDCLIHLVQAIFQGATDLAFERQHNTTQHGDFQQHESFAVNMDDAHVMGCIFRRLCAYE